MSEMIKRVAQAICRSRTCEGFMCCQWPANLARRHKCPVDQGNYDDAAKEAIQAMRDLPEDPGQRYANGDYSRRSQAAMVDDALRR